MNPLATRELLALWERGRGRHPVDRALLLYAAAGPPPAAPALADAPLGARDAALLALRRACFGARLEATIDCPHCGERLGVALDLDALAQPPAAVAQVTVDGASYRLPTSRDLAHIADAPDANAAAQQLAARCRVDDASGPADAAPDAAALARIGAALAAADPQADLSLALACDACEQRFEADVDPGALLWQDVEAAARRALLDVDLLARAYGWSEAAILALGDARRAAYVELASR